MAAEWLNNSAATFVNQSEVRFRLITLPAMAATLTLGAGSLLLTTNALHVPRRVPQPEAAEAVARATGASWAEIKVPSLDGVVLAGWLFTPRKPNGSAVIALHGVADSRLGMLAHAEFLLGSGFTVLVPDSRGHGESGGDIITYGVRESADVRCWAERLLRDRRLHRLYGIGQSMGAAILLQALKVEPRFRAVVADCSFASFEEISYERLQQVSGVPKLAFWPLVRLGLLYTQVAYGVDLRHASPVDAVGASHVPILLIHGAADTNIPPHHSEELQAANPEMTRLWIVPGAGHAASLGTAPQAYARNIVEWFYEHP